MKKNLLSFTPPPSEGGTKKIKIFIDPKLLNMITRLISIESQPKKVVVFVVVGLVVVVGVGIGVLIIVGHRNLTESLIKIGSIIVVQKYQFKIKKTENWGAWGAWGAPHMATS